MLKDVGPLIATAAQIFQCIGNTVRLAQTRNNQLMFFSTRKDRGKADGL